MSTPLLTLAALAALLLSACAGSPAPASETTATASMPALAAVSAETAAASARTVATTTAARAAVAGAAVPQASLAEGRGRLIVTVDDEDFAIRNGSEVVLGDGLTVELFLDPYPPTTLRLWLDVYLTRDGDPASDAEVSIEYDMLAMLHGPFWGDAENLGGGHYLLTLDYIMYGAWDQMITIRVPERRFSYRLPVVIVAFP